MERDSIDFSSENISLLFRKIFFPTLLGMVFIASITIADGIFVGQGVGSDALAAVNIVAPLFMLTAGIGLMFGIGASVVASIHLSRHKIKAANINITQALGVSVSLMLLISAAILIFNEQTARILGSSEKLLPLVLEYMDCIMPFMVFNMMLNVGLFVIRLDGAPNYAMACNIVSAVINVILDWLFIFPLGWGLWGAAFATGLAQVAGGIMILFYLFFKARTIRLYPIKSSRKSLRLTFRNVVYMIRAGAPALLGELAVASIMLVGNYAFITLLKEDGVAAFSVACYCLPIVFMIGNSVAQSAQPIISYNYGADIPLRVRQAFRLSLRTAVLCGILSMSVLAGLCRPIASLFLAPGTEAFRIAANGIPLFASGFVFFTVNIAWIGYYQSVERSNRAMALMILRGLIFTTASFLLLPALLGENGLWLAVPAAEAVSFCLILLSHRIPDGRMPSGPQKKPSANR